MRQLWPAGGFTSSRVLNNSVISPFKCLRSLRRSRKSVCSLWLDRRRLFELECDQYWNKLAILSSSEAEKAVSELRESQVSHLTNHVHLTFEYEYASCIPSDGSSDDNGNSRAGPSISQSFIPIVSTSEKLEGKRPVRTTKDSARGRDDEYGDDDEDTPTMGPKRQTRSAQTPLYASMSRTRSCTSYGRLAKPDFPPSTVLRSISRDVTWRRNTTVQYTKPYFRMLQRVIFISMKKVEAFARIGQNLKLLALRRRSGIASSSRGRREATNRPKSRKGTSEKRSGEPFSTVTRFLPLISGPSYAFRTGPYEVHVILSVAL